jgi:hypothetical protein
MRKSHKSLEVLAIHLICQVALAEMEVDEARADRVLRENGGDAVAALRYLVNT